MRDDPGLADDRGPAETLRTRAEALAATLGPTRVRRGAPLDGRWRVAPRGDAASFGLALEARSATGLLTALRRGEPAVIGRIEDDRVLLDLRTVEPDADPTLGAAIAKALDGRA